MFSALKSKLDTKNTAPKKITVLQGATIGAIGGAAEVLINHPLWTIKVRIQCGDPFTLDPHTLYRGILPNMASMVPSIALQVDLNQLFKKLFFKTTELSKPQQIINAFFAGAGSSLIRCPVELVLTHQRNIKRNFYKTVKFLIEQRGPSCLFIGIPVTATRLGIHAASFLAVRPMIKEQFSFYFQNQTVLSLGSGITAGIGSAIVSQPFDTVKTRQQANAHKKSMSALQAAKKLYAENGMYAFFKGGLPRGTRVVSAVTITGSVNESLENFFNKYNGNREERVAVMRKRL